MKYYWIFVGILLCTLPVGVASTLLGHLFGCENFFEVGCEPGVGSLLGSIGFYLTMGMFVVYPVAFLLGVSGGIIEFVRSKKKQSVPPAPGT